MAATKRKPATDETTDWPEFAEWLKLALTLDRDDGRTDAEINRTIDSIYSLEDMMEARACEANWDLNDRQIAILATIYIWQERAMAKPFDMRTTDFNSANLKCLMKALARVAQRELPQVPFKLRA